MPQDKIQTGDVRKKWVKNYWRVLFFLLIAVLIIVFTNQPQVPWKTLRGFSLVWIACFTVLIVLSILRKDEEGKSFDLWSVVHLLSGYILSLLGIPLFWSALLILFWELVEIKGDIREYRTNTIMDIVLGIAAWFLAKFLYSLEINMF